MATNLAPVIRQRFFDTNGDPLVGGKLYSYQAGTSTPQATYTDSTGGTPNANPVVLDANGEANVWLDPTLSYKFNLQNSLSVSQWTVDNVIGTLTAGAVITTSIADLAVTTAKLADDAVTAAKLADDASVDGNRAVTTNHIRNGAVTALKLASDAIGNTPVNMSLTATVAANALTISLVDAAGATPTVNSPVKIPFRSSTATDGSIVVRQSTAALTLIVPSATTIGTSSAVTEYLYVYAIDNAGTIELAVTVGGRFETGTIQSTSAISGGSTRTTLYSTVARSNLAVRLLGRIKISEATAGTWSSAPTEISVLPFSANGIRSTVQVNNTPGYASTNTKIAQFSTTRVSTGTAITGANSATLGYTMTINEDGVYGVGMVFTVPAGATVGISLNSTQLTTNFSAITAADRIISVDTTANGSGANIVLPLKAGDVLRVHGDGVGPTTGVDYRAIFYCTKISD